MLFTKVLETNFMQKVTNSPDYKDMAIEDAMIDLRYGVHSFLVPRSKD